MRRLVIGITLAGAVAATFAPARAQAPAAAFPPQWPQTPYAGGPYPFPAPTPADAYREGLITRWELERWEGPTPQALQGPSPNGRSGFGTGG